MRTSFSLMRSSVWLCPSVSIKFTFMNIIIFIISLYLFWRLAVRNQYYVSSFFSSLTKTENQNWSILSDDMQLQQWQKRKIWNVINLQTRLNVTLWKNEWCSVTQSFSKAAVWSHDGQIWADPQRTSKAEEEWGGGSIEEGLESCRGGLRSWF